MPIQRRTLTTQVSTEVVKKPPHLKPAVAPTAEPVRGEWLPPQEQRLLTVKQAAKYLGTSRGGVRRLVHSGKLEPIRLDKKSWRLDRADLDAFVELSKGEAA